MHFFWARAKEACLRRMQVPSGVSCLRGLQSESDQFSPNSSRHMVVPRGITPSPHPRVTGFSPKKIQPSVLTQQHTALFSGNLTLIRALLPKLALVRAKQPADGESEPMVTSVIYAA